MMYVDSTREEMSTDDVLTIQITVDSSNPLSNCHADQSHLKILSIVVPLYLFLVSGMNTYISVVRVKVTSHAFKK